MEQKGLYRITNHVVILNTSYFKPMDGLYNRLLTKMRSIAATIYRMGLPKLRTSSVYNIPRLKNA